MPAAGVTVLVSCDMRKRGQIYLCFSAYKRENSLNELGAAACYLYLPSSSRFLPFVTARHNELCALSGCGGTLVASFKRAQGGRGPGMWMLRLNIPRETQGSSGPCSMRAVSSGFAGLSAGRNPHSSKVTPCGMLMAGLCLFSIFLNRHKAALLLLGHHQMRGLLL